MPGSSSTAEGLAEAEERASRRLTVQLPWGEGIGSQTAAESLCIGTMAVWHGMDRLGSLSMLEQTMLSSS